jgi:Domain of unknown function (DUF4129)
VQLAREIEEDSRGFQQIFRRRTLRLKRQGIRAAYRLEGWLVSHKFLVLAIMFTILAGLILTDKSGRLAEMRFLWVWKFSRRDTELSRREATLTYQRLLIAMRNKGYRKTPSQTPREFAFSFLGTPWGPGVMEFTELYNTLRFGQVSVPLARLRRILEDMAKGK